MSWDDCRLLVESVVDYAILMLDPEGHVATWNAGAEAIEGYRADEIVGRHFSEFFFPEDVANGKPERLLESARAEGRIEDEGWRRRKDGSRFWANVIITALHDEEGKLRGYGKVTRDLSARRRAEDELRKAEERFHHLVDAVTDYAIFMLDASGVVMTWNQGARRAKGYEAGEIIGQHFSLFYTPEERAAGRPQRILETVRREGRFEDEGWRVRKDGSRFWANVVITSLRDDKGNIVGFAKVTRDLTERRRAEEHLRRAEERFHQVIDAVTDYAILMLDAQGNVATWNTGAARVKGYDASEIIGQHFSVFYAPEDRAAGKPERFLETVRREGRLEDESWRVRKDGTRFWANVVITALRDPDGKVVGFAKITRDLTARRSAEETERTLLQEQAARGAAEEGERRLRESEERYRALSRRLEVILEGVEDGITVQDRSGALVFANRAAARLCGYESTEAFLAAPLAEVFARFDILDELGLPFDPEKLPGRRVLRGEPASPTLLQVRERATGIQRWSLIRATAVTDADHNPELAINIWHDVTAERRHDRSSKYLGDATVALARSLDENEMLATLAQLLVPELTDWCSVHLVVDDRPHNVVVAHADPAKVSWAQKYVREYAPRPDDPRGVANVVRTGQFELYNDISEALLAQSARSEAHLEVLRTVGMRAVLIVPIRGHARVTGAISLVLAESGRRFEDSDVALFEELGRRAGVALENARLFAAERRAREHVELLARAGEAFSGTPNYEETLHTVVRLALPQLGDFGFFDIVEGDDVRRVAVAHEDDAIEALLKQTRWVRSERADKNLCALSTGASGIHPDIDDPWMRDVAVGPEHLELLRALRLRSMITVPLRARGELLGALTLCFGKSQRQHTQEDLRLAEELARRAAVAVVQVRLYDEARAAARKAEVAAARAEEAARRAEEASRIKDEFLATVSHELRTPLNAIVGWSSLLRARSNDPSIAKGVEVISRNAQAQAKIVEDILDVSRIITGKLRLDLKPADVVQIVRDAIEVVRPSAAGKRISITISSSADVPRVVGDPERLQQVIWNLLSNAVKFTDPGGSINITVERRESGVAVIVSDTGHGIRPDFLPYVFDRFKQADSSTTRQVGGLGLGLAIVRHIVELHGGKVQASSAGEGAGATFTVLLPVRAIATAVERTVEAPDPSTSVGGPAPALALSGLRVLVVDDERDARELLETVLGEAGATVESAASATEAVEAFRRIRPQVVVSDVGMPTEDGYSLIRRLRDAAGGAVPSLALTAYTRGEDKTKALAAGFSAHLGKPIHPDDLVAAVAKLVGR